MEPNIHIFQNGEQKGPFTEAQVRARKLSLEAVGEGVYKTTAIVNFKAGEMIGMEVLPKSLESAVAAVDEKPARPAARAANSVKCGASSRQGPHH